MCETRKGCLCARHTSDSSVHKEKEVCVCERHTRPEVLILGIDGLLQES